MAFVLADRVKETTIVVGTGAATLLGAASGYQSFSAGIGASNTTYYTIADQSGSNWEVGYGTLDATGLILTRTTVLSSSNSGSAVSFTTGTKDVWCDYTAKKAVIQDSNGVVTTPVLNVTSTTSTTPNLSFNASNSGFTSGASVSGSYLQTVIQNKSGTAGASTNYVLSNDLGTDSTYYGEFGMNSSVYSASTPSDFFSINNGIYFSGHDGDLTVGSGNGYKTYMAWGTSGQSAHVINASGAIGLSTNLGTTPTLSGTTGFGTSGQVLTSQGSASAPIWTLPTIAGFTSGESTATPNGTVYVDYLQASGASTNADVALVPKGTGAVLAQIPDSTATGGNKRGANAVDWQTSRTAASQVASGSTSFIGSGRNNTVVGQDNSIVGGYQNSISGGAQNVISGGATNSISAGVSGAGVLSGQSNAVGQTYSAIVGGANNTASGYYNFIGGGQLNSGTAAAAATTQSGTMNATTAVTLSGSNASIKVGQLITGTSIAFPTYVAAISGTSLTLSQAASGSSTSTLSFYTPHGVVVGGGNNQATGSYSFIGGGGDAGTAANRNVASGDWSFVGGGNKNSVSGNYATIVGGNNNTNTTSGASYSFIGGGQNNSANGFLAVVSGGYGNIASGAYSNAGGTSSSTRAIQGVLSYSSGTLGAIGDSQWAIYNLRKSTTDATSSILTTDTQSASNYNQVILPNNSAYYFKVRVIAGVTGAGNTKAWTLEGAIKRGAGVGTTAIVGTVTTTIVAADAGTSAWTVTATADTTNGGLAITVTGQAATTIRWVARAESTEMTY